MAFDMMGMMGGNSNAGGGHSIVSQLVAANPKSTELNIRVEDIYPDPDNKQVYSLEDIEELASMFKDMLGQSDSGPEAPYIRELQNHYMPVEDFEARYSFLIDGMKKPLQVAAKGSFVNVYYGEEEDVDVAAKLGADVIQSIIDGRMTFQRAFMTGEMTAKGNFKTLRMLDRIFVF